MTNTNKHFLLVYFLLCGGHFAYTQPNGGGGPGGGPPAPISGIEYLLGAGALYGLKKMIGKQKK
jgi:hypothetical protein